MAEATTTSRDYGLTAREREICLLVAKGYADREIALRLRISPTTLRRDMGKIFQRIAAVSEDRAQIEVRSGRPEALVSVSPPEAAWVRFWSRPSMAMVVLATLILILVLKQFFH